MVIIFGNNRFIDKQENTAVLRPIVKRV